MKNVFKSSVFLLLILIFASCSKNNDIGEPLEKNYIYDVNDIYIKPSSKKMSKTKSISDIIYVLPTIYEDESYNFEITSLEDDGSIFNVTFEKERKKYSKNNGDNEEDESFLSFVASHKGTAVGLLTSACAGMTYFIPFM
jgi:hypothetical protein